MLEKERDKKKKKKDKDIFICITRKKKNTFRANQFGWEKLKLY